MSKTTPNLATIAPTQNLNQSAGLRGEVLRYFEPSARQRPRPHRPAVRLKNENLPYRLQFVMVNAASDNEALLTDKEIVMDLLRRLPNDVTLYQIAQKLEFIAAVRQGLAEFDENKDSISIEQVERELTSWSVTVGRKRRGRRKAQRAGKTGEIAKNEKQVTR